MNRKIALIVLSLFMVIGLVLAACAPASSGTEAAAGSAPPAKKDGERKIGSTVIQATHPHVQAWIEGVKDVVESHGDEHVVLNPQMDPLVQSQQVDDLVASGCDGLVIETVDGEALVNAVTKAVEKGVYVVSSDSPFPADHLDLIISQTLSDNVICGEMITERMCQDLGGKGEVILLDFVASASTGRETGTRAVLENYPDVEIVAEGDSGCNIEIGNRTMQDLMQAHPNLSAVIGMCDDASIGALRALESAGRLEGVKIYGVDATPDAVKLMEEGIFTASVRQDPYMMGRLAAEDLYKAMNGEDVGEKTKYIDVAIVDASNAADYREYIKGGR